MNAPDRIPASGRGMKFADWVDEERGRTKAVAAHFGVTQSAVSQWKVKGVPLDRMRAMCSLSGGRVSLEEMLDERESSDGAVSAQAHKVVELPTNLPGALALMQVTSDFLRRMAELPASDPEVAHMLADDYLLRYLRETGQTAVASAYEDARKRVGFRYA